MACLEKEIELEVIFEKWQVSRLEELDGASAQQVQEWLKDQEAWGLVLLWRIMVEAAWPARIRVQSRRHQEYARQL